MVKLFEALALKKALSEEIQELVNLRSQTFVHIYGEMPEFTYGDLTKKIKVRVNDQTHLKYLLMKANMKIVLGNGLTLYEGILELANIRAAIEQLRSLMTIQSPIQDYGGRRTKDELKIEKQCSAAFILDLVRKYEAKRHVLDALIQEANHNHDIDFELTEWT